jgi:hypothetical protein
VSLRDDLRWWFSPRRKPVGALEWFFRRPEKPEAPVAPESDVVVVPIPPLVLLLDALQREKGRPLTEQEVLEIRDNAVCITMDRADAEKWAETRGRDIDPENVWAEWNEYFASGDDGAEPGR